MKDSLKKNKFIILLFVIFIFLLFGEFYLLRSYQKEKQIESNKESLQILANEKAAQVNLFLESKKDELKIISSMNVFRDAVLYPNDSLKIELARNRINELKDIIPGIGVLTKEGIIVVAENNPAGTDYSALPVFPMNNASSIVFTRYYDPQRKKDYYGVGGPIYDSMEKYKVIGAIAFDIKLGDIGNLMKETLHNGGTDEVYLIDENGLLLSGSEYLGKDSRAGILIQEVESDGAKECLEDLKKFGKEDDVGENSIEEHEEEAISYTNYLGNEVFGAHAYVPWIMGCVIAEESSEEVTKFSLTGYVTGNVIGKSNKKEVK